MAKVNDEILKVKEFYDEKELVDKLDKKFKETKANFYNYMDERIGNKKKLVYDSNKESYEVTKVTNVNTTYDIEVAKEILSKDTYKKIVNTRYEVLNMDGLVDYLKSLGADSRVVKEFFVAFTTIEKETLENAYSLGEISKDEKEAIETKTEGSSYYKVKKLK